jgi:phage major head subunit gpT-like protein
MSVVSEAAFTNTVTPAIKKVYVNAFNEDADASLIGEFYQMVNSERKQETYFEVEDIGNMPDFTGELNYTEFKEGNSKVLAATEIALGLKIQRKLVDDDLYGVIEALVKQMASVARYRMETDGVGPFVSAFSTTYTVFDGLALCSTAHTFVSTSTTQSNSGTSALSYAALEAALTAMRKFTNSQDRRMMNIMPDTLFVPVDLEPTAWEIINSQLKPGTNNNDSSFFYNKFKVRSSPLLFDTNNWFLIDSKRMKDFLIWQQRIPLEFNKDQDFDTYVKKYSSYMRYINSPLHWPFVYGQNVS